MSTTERPAARSVPGLREESAPRPARRAVLGLAACAGACLPLAAAPALADGESPEGAAGASADRAPARIGREQRRRRARRALEALQLHFATDAGGDMLSEVIPRRDGDPDFAYCWPLSQARAAACTLSSAFARVPAELETTIASLARAQESYWYPPGGTTGLPGYTAACDRDQGAHGDMYYDDNAWVGLQEVEEHLRTGGRRGDLGRARAVLELLRSGESTDPDLPHPGGIFWTQAGEASGRNTVSTIPSAKLALRLHVLTGDPTLLRDARRWVSWTRDTLLDEEGLFWDNISPEGTFDTTTWSYNQGVPLGTEALLFEITGHREHRDRAIALSDAILRRYQPFEDGGDLDREPLQFAAILMANLVQAQAIVGDRIPGRAVAQAFADRLWARRDPGTDLYAGDKREEEGRLHLLDHSGYARALAVAALDRKAARLLC